MGPAVGTTTSPAPGEVIGSRVGRLLFGSGDETAALSVGWFVGNAVCGEIGWFVG